MYPDFKQKWIAALRSGEHKQHFRLANDSYGRSPSDPRPVGTDVQARCCLNVGAYALLGERANEMGSVECFELLVGGVKNNSWAYVALIDLNDVKKASFADIANWIEDNL